MHDIRAVPAVRRGRIDSVNVSLILLRYYYNRKPADSTTRHGPLTGRHRQVARTARRLVRVLHRGSWTHFKRPWDKCVCAPGDSRRQALDGECGRRARCEEMCRASAAAPEESVVRGRCYRHRRQADRPTGSGARVHG